ncbi:MAG: hypothetical protein FWH03_06010 [Firmicutes bacterium]|nr:hypothetical protein [Bacillota bacterium]
MAGVYAVCPHCGKNIMLASEHFDSVKCPLCEGQLTVELLRIKNSFIDSVEANYSFETGKQYFDNTNYREAMIHFQKSLEYNANHYLSFYYAGLCEVYDNENNEEYDTPLQIMRLLKYSLFKLENAQVDMQYKIPFVRAAISEISVMMLAQYNKLCENFYEDHLTPHIRAKLTLIGKYVGLFVTIDKQLMLVFDKEIADGVISLIEVGIDACIKASSGFSMELMLQIPTQQDYEAASKIAQGLLEFAQTLDPKYSLERHRPDFSDNVAYNKDTLTHIKNYYESLDKKHRSQYLTVPSELLQQLIAHCHSAATFTFNTLFKNIYIKKNDPLRQELLLQGLTFCLEMLMPRVHIDGYKRVMFSSKNRNIKREEILEIFIEFAAELVATGRKALDSALNQFYLRVNMMTGLYFDIVSKNYEKSINRIKADRKSKEFIYYNDFVVNVIFACALALMETIELRSAKKPRIGILKTGKLAVEEFLLLHDYKVFELEKIPPYAEILRIYNMFEYDIVEIQRKV